MRAEKEMHWKAGITFYSDLLRASRVPMYGKVAGKE